MEKQKKINSLKLIFISICLIFASAVLTACGCQKKIEPESIRVNITSKNDLYVGDTFNINVYISPTNSSNTNITISNSNANIVKVDKTSLTGVEGTITVTALNIGTSTITFKIDGTNKKAVTTVVVNPDPVELTAPQNLRYEDGSLKWDAVSNAVGYVLDINGKEYSVTSTSFGTKENEIIEKNIINTVKIKSKGDGIKFLDSSYGIYEESPYKFIQLDKVQNVSHLNKVVTWDAIENAFSYEININEKAYVSYENSFNLDSAEEASSYTIKVKAIVNPEIENGFSGEYSSEIVVNVLTTPTNFTTINNVKDSYNKHSTSKVQWDAVLNATKYVVTIAGNEYNKTFETTDTSFELVNIDTNEVLKSGNYTVFVKAVGDGVSFIDSDNSATFNFEIIKNVENASIENNVLTIDSILQASSYDYIFVNKNTNKEVVINSSDNKIDLSKVEGLEGINEIYVKSIAQNKNGLFYANGNLVKLNVEFEVLQNPTISKISNSGLVTFNKLDKENITYNLYLDDSETQIGSTTTNSFQLEKIEAGEHTLKVVAVGDGIKYITSAYAQVFEFAFTKLSAVQNFVLNNLNVSWQANVGASQYGIVLNENEEVVQKSSTFNLTSANLQENNQIKVVAYGNDYNVINSDYATYTFRKLMPVKNIRIVDGILTWDEIQDANYELVLNNGKTLNVSTNSYDFADLESGFVGTIKIKAFKSDCVESDYSEEFSFKKLEKVSNLRIEKVDEIYYVKWDAVSNASGYEIVITDPDMMVKTIPSDINQYKIDNALAGGNYLVSVKTIAKASDGEENYANSDLSESVNFVKLNVVSNITLNNDETTHKAYLTWDSQQNATAYRLWFKTESNPSGFEVVVTTNKYDIPDGKTSNFKLAGNWTVTITAIGNNTNVVNGETSSEVIITKIAESTKLSVENGKIVLLDEYSALIENGNINSNIFIDVFVNNVKATDYSVTKQGDNFVIMINGLEEDKTNNVYVVVNVNGFVSSNESNTIKVNKLGSVKNFRVENKKLKWDAVNNATSYIITNIESGATKEVEAVTELDLSNFDLTKEGIYTFNIVAVGSLTLSSEEVGYLTSNETLAVAVTKLSAINNARVENGVLVWEVNEQNSAFDYEIEVSITNLDNLSKTTKIYTKQNAMQYDFADREAGNYKIEFVCKSKSENLLDSNVFELLDVKKLKAPTSVRLEGGIIKWQDSEDSVSVENGKYEVVVGEETIVVNSFDDSKILNAISETETKNLKVRYVAENYINSDFSDVLIIKKLSAIFDLSVSNNALMWSAYNSTICSGYEVTASAEVFNGLSTFQIAGGASNSLDLTQFNIQQGDYQFTVKAIGNTVVAGSSSVAYISSEQSNSVTVKVLPSTTSVGTSGGYLIWSKVDNATSYKLNFYKAIFNPETNEYDCDSVVSEFRTTSNTYFDMNGVPENNYIVKIIAMGNNKEILNSAENSDKFRISNMNLIVNKKLNVLDGKLTWNVLVSDVLFALNQEELTQADINAINGILNGTQPNDELKLKLSHVINYDAIINGAVTKLVAENVKLNGTSDQLIFSTTFKYEAGNYVVKLRTTSNNISAGNNISDDIVRYVYGPYTSEISFVKLPTPVSPVNENTTAILNNNLTWQKVVVAGDESKQVDYQIIAEPASDGIETVINLNAYNENFSSQTNQYSVNVRDLNNKLIEGSLYNIYVIAYGTKDSSTEQGTIYVSSEYAVKSPVTLLTTPDIFIENGIIKWNHDTNVIKYELDIVESKQDGMEYHTELTGADSEFDMCAQDVKFPSGNYRVSLKAIGDGITKIDTGVAGTKEIVKVENVTNVSVSNGKFVFNLSNTKDTIDYELVVITYNSEGLEISRSEPIVKQYVRQDDVVLGEYELPDTFKATDSSGNKFEYVLQVRPLGTIKKTSNSDGSVVLKHNGDVSSSAKYTRIDDPKNLKAQNGKIVWDSVANANEYVIKVGDKETNLGNNNVYTLLMPAGSSYDVSVKAILNNNSIYLNSPYSNIVLFRVIDTPELSTLRGVVRWADTTTQALPCSRIDAKLYRYSSNSYDTIVKEYDLEQLSSETKEYDMYSKEDILKPSGYYKLSITFVGNDELVNVPNGQSYYYLSSQTAEIKFFKLEAPTIQEDSKELENAEIENFAFWNKVDFAVGYNVKIVSKKDSSVVLNLNTESNMELFEETDDKLGIKLKIKTIEEQATKLGLELNEYDIYVSAYGPNEKANDNITIYTLSDYSNALHMVLPIAPINLQLDAKGTLTWENVSADTKPVVYLSYTDGSGLKKEENIILDINATSYKLKYIANDYTIKIRSLRNDKIYSDYSEEVLTNKQFNLYASGNGTKELPYILQNENQLKNIIYYTESAFKLGNNITLGGQSTNWQIIDSVESTFIFDGNNKTISNIILKGTSNNSGFINSNNGVIKNLRLQYTIDNLSTNYFGGVAVNNFGTISNCIVEGYNGSKAIFNYNKNVEAGGIVNFNAENATIQNSVNKLEFDGKIETTVNQTKFGGIAVLNNGTISNCGNVANISGLQIAGIVVTNANFVENCYVKSTLSSNNKNNARMIIGGLVAENSSNKNVSELISVGKIVNSYAIISINAQNGNTSQENIYVGGLIARQLNSGVASETLISNSYVVINELDIFNVGSQNLNYGSIMGRNEYNSNANTNNVYVRTDKTIKFIGNMNDSSTSGITAVSEDEAKQESFATSLGSAFKYVEANYPILTWEENYEL